MYLSGDGTGYSLTVTKHYRTQGNKEGGKNFIYSFTMMGLKTGLYICHSTGVRSEKEADFLQTKGCLDGKFGRKEMKEYALQWPALLRCTIFSELAIRELCPKARLFGRFKFYNGV
jgi:hypothetical protein